MFEGGWRGTHLDTRLGLITGRKASTQEFHSRAPVSVWNIIISTEVNLVFFIHPLNIGHCQEFHTTHTEFRCVRLTKSSKTFIS